MAKARLPHIPMPAPPSGAMYPMLRPAVATMATPRRWPPFPAIPEDRPARIWYNSSFTEPHHLINALAYFNCTGWPSEALDDFLDAIRPPVGWAEEWDVPLAVKRKQVNKVLWRRHSTQYGPAWFDLRNGWWEPGRYSGTVKATKAHGR